MSDAPRVVRYRAVDGARIGLVCTETQGEIRLVSVYDTGVRIQRLPATERRYMVGLGDYRPKRVARGMLRAGRRLGISQAAKNALRGVALARAEAVS